MVAASPGPRTMRAADCDSPDVSAVRLGGFEGDEDALSKHGRQGQLEG